MSDVYMLVIREPSEERVRYKGWQATMREQLNHVAVMLLAHLHRNPAAIAVFDIQDESARTIRFTAHEPAYLHVIEEYARELGLEVVLGPVEKPETATEQMEREISHTPWHVLERRVASGLDEGWMQLAHRELGRRELDFTREVRSWDAERIGERLRNSLLSEAERRILEERRAVRL